MDFWLDSVKMFYFGAEDVIRTLRSKDAPEENIREVAHEVVQ